ncbi:MAG: SWIM zinc finger family protein [Alkalibacterium sp.]|nr:SWIM zinc finger family protein [Alkalibacterium sp.]
MKLSTFEEIINPLILDRGKGYYHTGAVKSFTGKSDTLFEFQIIGSIMYSVIIELKKDKDTIAYTDCDCPYDKGPYCKHVVTALYYLRNHLQDTSTESSEKDLDKLLSAYSQSDLKNLILELLDNYPAEKDRLLIKHTDFSKDTQNEMVTETLYEIIESYKGYQNFVNYYDTMDLTDDLHDLLETIRKTEDKIGLIPTLLHFHTEVVKMIEFCDDSAGSVGTLLDSIIEELTTSLAQASFHTVSEKLTLLTTLEQTLNDSVYESWDDAAYELLAAFKGNLFEKESRDYYFNMIDKKIKNIDKDLSVFYSPRLLLLKANVVKEYESEEAYMQFLERYDQFENVKIELLTYLLEQNKYDAVVHKIEELKSNSEDSLRKDFLKLEFEAFRGLQDIPKLERLGKDLIMEGEFDYYSKVKEVTPDPDAFYQDVKAALKEKQSDFLLFHVYKDLLLLEDDREGLLELTKLHMPLIETVVNLLREPYPKETFAIYTQYLYRVAEDAANRKEYRALCYKISTYGRLFGNMHKEEVIQTLQKQYKRKPALMDELGKI